MAEIVNLAERRREPESSLCAACEVAETNTGPARCLHCKHEWVAVAPAGVVDFECPACGLYKGHRIGICVPPADEEIWICQCGGDLFMLRRHGPPLCVKCGLGATSWVES